MAQAAFFHNQYLIAPVAVVGVVDVGFNLINHLVGFLLVEHRQAAYAYVNRFGSDVKTCVVAESSEEVVGNVCGDDVVAIAALESEQIVFAKLFAELTVVEITAAMFPRLQEPLFPIAPHFSATGNLI